MSKQTDASASSDRSRAPISLEGEVIEDVPVDENASADKSENDEDIVDMGSTHLALRQSRTLADGAGEWVRDEGQAKQQRAEPVDDLYRAFVRHATQFDRLSEEVERTLGLRVRDHQDKDAAKKLVVHNLRLAIKFAHQHRRSWTNLMDLVQEAAAGMAIAAEKWDPDQGTRFGTYAAYWMRAQLTKFLMTHGRIIHTGNTRSGRRLYFELPKVRRRLLAAGKEPNVENIAEALDEDPEEVARILPRLEGREASLSAPVGEGDTTLGDLVEGPDEGPEQNAFKNQMAQMVGALIEQYTLSLSSERDLAIWTEHLISGDPVSLVELGKRYGVSKQRMGQLSTRLRRGFRRHVIDTLGPDTQLSWLFNQD